MPRACKAVRHAKTTLDPYLGEPAPAIDGVEHQVHERGLCEVIEIVHEAQDDGELLLVIFGWGGVKREKGSDEEGCLGR